MKDPNKVRDAAEAVKGIVEAVPVYQDALQPAAREVGKALQTVAKTIHVALAPISALVWGFENIKEFVSVRVAEKLRNVPPERIQTPKANVVGPALEALRYTGPEESLRDLYANLLANSLDADTAKNAHPAFVDMIKSMSPDEARIMRLFATRGVFPLVDLRLADVAGTGYQVLMRNFSLIGKEAGCEHPELTTSYLNNLDRLGLILLPDQGGIGTPHLTDSKQYEVLEAAPELATLRAEVEGSTAYKLVLERRFVEITSFGSQFCNACVIDKNVVNPAPGGEVG